MNNWTEISEASLLHNFRTLQAAAGQGTEVLAVIKANAYGHGATVCARMLAAAGATWMGVTCAAEGARVREALAEAGNAPIGVTRPADLLVMSGFLPEDADAVREHRLTPVLWSGEQIAWLAGCRGLRVHVEVDTGMGRQGVEPGAPLAELLSQLSRSGLVLDGLFTHFCSSEVANSSLTRIQQQRFEQAVAQVAAASHGPSNAAGYAPIWIHAGNSSTLDNPLQPTAWLAGLAARAGARSMVRSGLALYGYCLPLEGSDAPAIQSKLQPVLTWKARVLAVRELQAGDTVGYNATFTAPAPMRVALLPAGYADGLRRELSGCAGSSQALSSTGGWAMIAGQKAPILGRISMNLTVVDVTGIPVVRAGDEAVLLGAGITADDHGRLARTIAYEILCGIHPCN